MGILPSELSGAQDLLVKLVQILTPFIESEGVKDPKGIASFSQRLFVPPRYVEQEEPRLPSRVRLLTTLESAQKQVTRWIETLSTDNPSAPLKKREEPQTQEKVIEKQKAEPSSIPRPARPQERLLPEMGGRNEIQCQAKDLVSQVRRAIQTLSTSLSIEEPRLNAFRDVMKKLKPMIEELIVAVGKSEMANSGDGSESSKEKTRNATPIPARAQQFFKSEIPLPFRERKEAELGQEKRSSRDVAVEKKEERPVLRSFSKVPVERGGERAQPAAPKEQVKLQPAKEEPNRLFVRPEPKMREEAEPIRQRTQEPKVFRQESLRPRAPVENQAEPSVPAIKRAAEPAFQTPQSPPRAIPEETKTERAASIELKPTPLAAPFTPPIVPSATSKKGKKKNRNFWLKDAEDEEESEKERD